MDHEALIDTVPRRSRVPRDDAESLTRAMLHALAERLTRGEADDLASELPEPPQTPLIAPAPEAEGYGPKECADLVSRRCGLSVGAGAREAS
ncbi:DUF2267 domain-containing protein [Streptomyces tuirus]